jgi:predicted DNA-binding helix-hairpin-helix protein
MLLRIPGVGPKSAKMILAARQFRRLNSENLRKIGVVMKRAQFFITCNELATSTIIELQPDRVRSLLTMDLRKKNLSNALQLSLW